MHRPTWYSAAPTMHHAIVARPAVEDQHEDLRALPVIEVCGLTEVAGELCSNPLFHRRQRCARVRVHSGRRLSMAVFSERITFASMAPAMPQAAPEASGGAKNDRPDGAWHAPVCAA